MGATLNLVPRALSLALEPKPGKSALGTRLGYAKRMDEGGVCPSIPQVDPTLRLDNLERLCRSLVVKKKIGLCLIYPASRVSFPIFLGRSKETLLACRVPLIRPHPNNRSINHFQGKLLLCLYGWKILNIVSTSKTNKERTAERTVFPDNLTCSKESLGADIPLVPLPSDPEVESYLSWARVKPACEVTLKTSFSCFPLLLVFKVHRNPQTFGFIFHDNVNPSFDWLKHNTNQYRYQSWLNSDFFKNPA